MRPDIKYYLIPAGFLVIIVFIILLLPFNIHRPASQSIPSLTQSPLISSSLRTPTRIKIPTPFITSSITPTPLPPKDFTGAVQNQKLPQHIIDLATQKTDLRMKTPLTFPFGTISFNYETDRFSVKLLDPKEINKNAFETWLKQTYPAIPLDRFAFE